MIPLLAPLFPAEWAAFAEPLQVCATPPADAVCVARLIDQPQLLARALQRYADELGVHGPDLRAVASAWTLDYVWTLLPGIVAAASVLQHGFAVAAADLYVQLGAHGRAQAFYLRGEGEAQTGLSTAARYDTLLWRHLQPLFAALHQHSRLPRKILWGNAARHLETLLDHALSATGHAPHVAADRAVLLDHAQWPDGRRNPLFSTPCSVLKPGAAAPLTLHRQCCLFNRLPGEDYCGACPLAPQHIALKAATPTASVAGLP